MKISKPLKQIIRVIIKIGIDAKIEAHKNGAKAIFVIIIDDKKYYFSPRKIWQLAYNCRIICKKNTLKRRIAKICDNEPNGFKIDCVLWEAE